MSDKELTKYAPDKYNLLVRPEDLNASPLLKVDLSVVQIDARDVRAGGETHNIGGQLTPSRSALDKIADATGIDFTQADTRKEGENIWVGKSSGRRKNPDGTWRNATCEYELDLDVRAEEVHKRQSDKAKAEKEILQLRKFARQRADTGARLRVIRELTGLKTGFAQGELDKPFVFARYQINTELIMSDPDMKRAAINQALGTKQEIFGEATVKDVTPEPEQLPDNTEPEAEVDDFEDDIPELPEEKNPVEELRQWFTDQKERVPETQQQWIDKFLSQDRSQKLEVLTQMKASFEAKMAAAGGVK